MMQTFREDEKLKVFIQANFQSHALRAIFQRVERLNNQYEIIDIKPVHLWQEEDFDMIIEKVKNCDIFLHQPIFEKNFGQFASDNLKKYLKKSAKAISFPNLYFTGYHPQAFYLKDASGKKVSEPFDYHDKNIVEFYKQGLNEEEILEKIQDESFYSVCEIEANIAESLKALRDREKHTDIKVSDYIEKNMIGRKLFHIFNHPNNEMIFYLFNSILTLLDESKLDDDERALFKKEMLGQVRYPVYPSVQKYFEIKDDFALFIKDKKYSIKEVVSLYLNTYDKKPIISKRKIFDSSTKLISNFDIPNHPRMNIGNKLLFPDVYIENIKNIVINFNKGVQYKFDSQDVTTEYLGRVLNLFTPGASIYTHWLFDLLPKIECVKKAGLEIDDYDIIIVNAKHTSFQKASIAALGLDESKIFPIQKFDSQKYYKCDLLTSVSAVRKNYATSTWIIEYIKNLFTVQKPNFTFSDKIYISRNKATRRIVINEDEVTEYLKSEGFDILNCEDYSINEVHYILSNASFVIAPHGAGLANIAFCKPRTRIIELFSQHLSPEYYYFSEILEFNYSALPCKDENGMYFNEIKLDYKNNFFEINGANILVDIDRLKLEIRKK